MDQALLERFQQAYKDLDLFPLVEPEDIERFRVDYGLPVMVRLKREIEASVKSGVRKGKFMPSGSGALTFLAADSVGNLRIQAADFYPSQSQKPERTL